jgi:hypothetical protein
MSDHTNDILDRVDECNARLQAVRAVMVELIDAAPGHERAEFWGWILRETTFALESVRALHEATQEGNRKD